MYRTFVSSAPDSRGGCAVALPAESSPTTPRGGAAERPARPGVLLGHWSDEIRDPQQEIPDLPKTSEASAGELKMAHQLI
ncbi:hypothetical protein ACWEPM_38540, partial [Streptomyces sp. NPDC004244]